MEGITADSAAERGGQRLPSISLWFQRLCLTAFDVLLPLASVVLFMGLQVVLEQLVLGEGQSTDGADVRCSSAVDLLMSPQCSESGEALTADVAAVWFDAGVTPHVRFHILKCLPADLTRPAAADGFSVRSEMVVKTI